MSGDILIPRRQLQTLLDAVIGSLDFGSGFLDSEEVEALRAVAVLLGADPMAATPSNFTQSYPHEFAPVERVSYDWGLNDPYQREKSKQVVIRCRACERPQDWQAHR